MLLNTKLMRAYFNYAYNPVYDFTTGRLSCYRKLQERCVRKLKLKDKDRVLCLGIGTGNEIFHILEMNKNVDITAVDYSSKALRKAHKKAMACGKEIDVFTMDAHCLEFTTGSFDEVICIHVMDFVEDSEKVTIEILRVLKDGGQFVITYPSKKEGMHLGFNLLREIIHDNTDVGRYRVIASLQSIAQMLVGIIYLPLFLRPKKGFYSRKGLKMMITKLTAGNIQIEDDAVYQDFIICGRKLTGGGD